MRWEYDPNHSRIGFSARHLGISTIRGQFDRADVQVDLESDDPTQWRLSATIAADSINTGLERRDDALRGENYLNVARYPTIRFESLRAERCDDGYVLIGALTILETTREVELAVAYNGEAEDRNLMHRGFSASAMIDRFDFALGDPKVTWTVGDTIRLELDMEAVQK
ncbi:MAG TPA: YceI family protein [Chloroflexota bacterium]|nr:YceI family protein [Chloroflexota bacterium]